MKTFSFQPSFEGLSLGPSQVCESIRLVPLIREATVEGIRLHRTAAAAIGAITKGSLERPEQAYVSYVPHAMVVDTDDGPAATMGTALMDGALKDGAHGALNERLRHGLYHRMAKGVRGRRKTTLRFLPLHLAMEGFLVHHFKGPARIWPEYTHEVMRRGLSPRYEHAVRGAYLPRLDDALRLFELHEGQSGVLFFVGDRLRSAIVAPSAEAYRKMHRALLTDFFADSIRLDAAYDTVPDWTVEANETPKSLDDLAGFVQRIRDDWSEFHAAMADELFGRAHEATRVYKLRGFELIRFLPDFSPSDRHHIGEAIVDGKGRLAYLKTYRLSRAQAKRGYLLSLLADHDWDLSATAESLGASRSELVLRIRNAGFAYLFRAHVIQDALAGRL
ncbi:MAG: hypothetical protein AAF645_09405 [Myxococcota bacterium]